MNNQPLLSLLITTRNRKEDLLRTLRVMMGLLPMNAEVIVFDDGSTDGTGDLVAMEFPGVRLVSQQPAIGYIGARNRLLTMANGDYAISLDDDSEIVSPFFPTRLQEHFVGHPRCAVLALSIYWGIHLPEGLPSLDGPVRKVKSFVGCGHVWRMSAWRSIAEYPPWFGMYGEEDFAAMSLLKQEWEVHYYPGVLVHHRVDLRSRRKTGRFGRYRRHFRAGLFNMLLFFPWAFLPRRLASAFWAQIRNHLILGRDWVVIPMLTSVCIDLLRNSWRIIRSRSQFTRAQWEQWNGMAPTVIYWRHERCEVPVARALHGG